MEHNQLLRSPFAFGILDLHTGLDSSLKLAQSDKKANELGPKVSIVRGLKKDMQAGLARLFSLETRALLVAASLSTLPPMTSEESKWHLWRMNQRVAQHLQDALGEMFFDFGVPRNRSEKLWWWGCDTSRASHRDGRACSHRLRVVG